MQLQVNGQSMETGAVTLADLLQELNISPGGTAVAINQQVVRRAMHGEKRLSPGDQIEIIRAVQGG